MNFEAEKNEKIRLIEEIISKYLPKEEGPQKTVIEAMNYSITVGGKRVRPMLMRETFKLFEGDEIEVIEYFMTALEMIHTYSLVHDDLPCMDNDEYRRGCKTTHVVYGAGMATLAGDGLLNYACEIACKAFEVGKDPARVGKAVGVLFNKSGIYGMIGGQTADIESEGKDASEVNEELLLFIHEKKTAALIQAAMMIGGILGGANDITVRTLERIAYNVGVAFQIQDDILDVTSTFEELGKPIGSDEKNKKVTYVTLHGIEESTAMVEKLSKEAITLLHTLPGDNPFLEELLLSMITRKK
ncbi:MAG: polyprenyl synthetase family protein [Lachnospiraceae bacterium]|nr:polyprenyl synthetase family protein [Candidatus Colinaster scatohippi]